MSALVEKTQLRSAMRALLRAMPEGEVARASTAIVARLQGGPAWSQGARAVALFGGLKGEPDLLPLLPWLHARGIRAAFFVIRADEMEAFEVRDREELETGPFGVWVPRADDARHIAARDVSVVLTPGLAFGRADGSRLGRGAGFYDRFFARADVMARRIGVCLGSQLRERVPAEPHDAPMHAIVTEERFLQVHAS